MFSQSEVEALSAQFEAKTPQEIIRWAVESFAPDIAMSTSFQTQSMPLLHMAVQIMPGLRIFFLDTGYHFWDTLIFREKIQQEWKLNVIDLYRELALGCFSAAEHAHPAAAGSGLVLLYS